MDNEFEWTSLDRLAVDTSRVLAMDAVEKAGSGHAGTAMSLAPLAYLLFQRLLRHDPRDPQWLGRDRFILSCGHTSLTQYIQLYLSGYGITLADLKSLRQRGSCTPGHPEYGRTPGVETTTGPLGQGLGNAVGMAMAARRERGLFDPGGAPDASPFDHTIWAIVSDGDIDEGISHEASAIAGHQRLGNLIVVYDDNHISLDNEGAITRSEDVTKRYEAYGWQTQKIDWTSEGSYKEDVASLYAALIAAKSDTTAPSFISLRTIIGWPAPTLQNSAHIHGSALGAAEVAATKQILGFPPTEQFTVPGNVLAHTRGVLSRAARLRAEWDELFSRWQAANPKRAAELSRISARQLPDHWEKKIPEFPAAPALSTRAASGAVLTAIGPVLPELWGGSADLAESCHTTMEGEPSFVPEEFATKSFPGHRYGRTLHFGIREHAMGAILSGIALHGGTRPYGGTFLTFSDYMRPAVRLAAMMKLPVIYVWTHDSLGVGGDGPTHQPVEHLWALRAIPGLDVVRPADANEAAIAWRTILHRSGRPAGLCLTRQPVPTLSRGGDIAPAEGTARGGYVLAEASVLTPQVILIATGSEVHVALTAREILEREGVPTRLVSMPCLEWFSEQDDAYRRSVLPADVRARVSVEAGAAVGWWRFVGEAGECVSLEQFGGSADPEILFQQFGFTAAAVVAAARVSLARARKSTRGQSC